MAACGDLLESGTEVGGGDAGATPTPGVPWLEGTAVDTERLSDWVRAGAYQLWERSPGVFRSTAGGGSRIYVNEVLAQSLAAGTSEHPYGSIGVREITFDDLMTLRGVNVTVKLEEGGEDAQNWLFVELVDSRPGGAPTVLERAAPACLTCHGLAPDFVRSEWPLR